MAMSTLRAEDHHSAGLNHWADVLAVVFYFAATLGVGVWSICRPTRKSVQGFFLAGRTSTWWPIGLSLFASNISSEHFVGLAGAGAASGIAVIWFEWSAIFLILLMSWVFLPVYLTCGVYTLPEYMMKRFGGQRLRLLVSVLFVFSTCNAIMPVELYSGGLFMQQALGWNIYYGMLLIIGISVLYSALGGLATVLYTDAIQVVIMLAGAIVVSAMGLSKIGGLSELRHRYMTSESVPGGSNVSLVNDTNAACYKPRPDAWHIFRDPVHADYPWAGTLFRVTLGGIHYWCTSQTIVQRSLAAKTLSHAKGAAILAGTLKIAPLFIMVFPGMVARVLFPSEVACADADSCMRVCGSAAGCSNIAYPRLVLGVLPQGLRGVVTAVMLSAVISSLTSHYNSVATVVTLDIWTRFRPQASERELLMFGRLWVIAAVCLSLAWIPVLHNAEGGQIFKYITTVVGYLGAPLNVAFLLAMLWTRANEKGTFWGFLSAGLLGVVRFTLDVIFPRPACGMEDRRPSILASVHPYYFVTIQLLVGTIVTVTISLATSAIPREKLAGLTYWTRREAFPDMDDASVALSKVGLERRDGDNMPKEKKAPEERTRTNLDLIETEKSRGAVSWWQRLLVAMCGLPSRPENREQTTEERDSDIRALWARTREDRLTRYALNTLAVLLMLVIVALFIYFR